MESIREADPDFDGPPSRGLRLVEFDPGGHQRLVVNPFLAPLALLAWWWMIGGVLQGSLPPAATLATFGLVLLPKLIRFHCLDCGRSGPYPAARGHACPDVYLRWQDGREGPIPWRSAWGQLGFWIWVLASAGVLLSILLSDWGED